MILEQIYSIYPAIIIFGLQFASNIRDFIKAIAHKLGLYLPKYEHTEGWHIYTMGIWILPVLAFTIGYGEFYWLTAFLTPHRQDLLYYLGKFIFWKEPLPERLPHLQKLWFLKWPWEMTKRNFLFTVIIGEILNLIYWMIIWLT